MSKILLIDDEALILYSLSKTLKHSGADVIAVTNGTDALNEMQRSTYDICFLDVQLPDANGLDLMKVIRKLSPATGIIIMTASRLSEEQQRMIRSHGCHFLPKPFDLDQVQEVVAILSSHPVAGND